MQWIKVQLFSCQSDRFSTVEVINYEGKKNIYIYIYIFKLIH